MNLIEQINQELSRGFTKSELERIFDLPKNSLSAVLNPENKAKLSKKAEIRVKAYFDVELKNRPLPSPKIAKNKLKPNANDKVEAENISNQLTNAARGRDENGVNNDEYDGCFKGIRLGSEQDEVPNYQLPTERHKAINIKDYKPTTYPPEQSAGKTLIQQMDEQLTKNTEKVKNEMPKGLSLIEQLEWREKNL